jgi:MFS family permease
VTPSRSFSPLSIALAGLVALGIAMGIGRFAFTPLLPMMLAERTLDLTGASLLASVNYFGYLLGAVVCTFQPWIWRRFGWTGPVNGPALVRGGLVATAILTLAMAAHVPGAWVALRFAAGVASAVVLIYTSGFCLEELARRGEPAMGALIFAGPGMGIFVTGVAAMGLAQLHATAAAVWAVFGFVAFLLTALVWPVFDAKRGIAAPSSSAGPARQAAAPEAGAGELALLTLAYGLAGIGYIITATFLPVIARQALPGSQWLDLFWPLVGLSVAAGALVVSRLRSSGDLRLRLSACYVMQAAGVAAGVVSPTLAGFVVGSLLFGLPFTAITYFGMQEARRIRPHTATSVMGVLSVSYGLGQVAGPPLAAALVARSPTAQQGFALSLWIASGLLLFGAALYVLIARLHPMQR